MRFPDDPTIISPRIRESLQTGRYEKNEATQIEKVLEPGDRVLELGAGIGFISTIAALNAKTELVLCYEADPRLIGYIRSVHELNDVRKATVRHAVLTTDSAQRELTVYVRKDFWGSSLSMSAGGFDATVSVPAQSFNETVEKFRPKFVVCDTEGAELDLLMNANLHGVTRVLLELHTKILGRQGVKKLFDAMSARDFHYDQYGSNGSVVLFSHVTR